MEYHFQTLFENKELLRLPGQIKLRIEIPFHESKTPIKVSST